MTAEATQILWSNNRLVGLQSRLYSPGYVGPARWVLFDPGTRRAFSALGKDIVPEVIGLLSMASGGTRRRDLLSACPGIDDRQLDDLISAGLLVCEPVSAPRAFSAIFHAANVDYPFFDYGTVDVAEQESRLLDHYQALWPSPPPLAEHDGPAFDLPPAGMGFPEPCRDRFPELDVLAQILRTLLAPIGEIRTRHTVCIRRTVPSGGARHPTEVVWVSKGPVGALPAGAYAYGADKHQLVREPPPAEEAYLHALGRKPFGFIVRSRVGRSMWRYRDLRALRPALIDAGHVVEMLSFLLIRAGIPSDMVTLPLVHSRPEWLAEPEIALVVPTAAGCTAAPEPTRPPKSGQGDGVDHLDGPTGAVLCTNPAMVLRFAGSLAVEVLWPHRRRRALDLTDFLILNHCLPSARGDRDGSPSGILRAVPSTSRDRIASLRSAGALLPIHDADPLYSGLRLWVRHEWYLAALAMLEASSDSAERPVTSHVTADGDYIRDSSVLLQRRTRRRFSKTPVTSEVVEALLHRSVGGGTARLTVSAALHRVLGAPSGLYRWSDGRLERVGPVPTGAEIAKATAGQTAAAEGALTVWLSLLTDPEGPTGYITDLLDLGRLGQRLCEVATEYKLATFLTPAAHDRATCSLLRLAQAERLLTYVFAFGEPETSEQGNC